MTPDERHALAARLVAADWWEWGHGMSWLTEDPEDGDWYRGGVTNGGYYRFPDDDDALPDLTDPATGGVLLGMLAKAAGPLVGVLTTLTLSSGATRVDVKGRHWTAPHLGEACALALLEVLGG